jgi:hypothetical protein
MGAQRGGTALPPGGGISARSGIASTTLNSSGFEPLTFRPWDPGTVDRVVATAEGAGTAALA